MLDQANRKNTEKKFFKLCEGIRLFMLKLQKLL